MTRSQDFNSRLYSVFAWLEDDHVTRLWLACGASIVAFLLVLTPAVYLDDRLVDGVSTWSKPIKFATSLSLHALTLALLGQLLERCVRTGWTMTIASYAGVIGVLFEQVYITLQAARARRSHFNFETDIESLMYIAMGVGAILLILPTMALGLWLVFKAGRGSPALRLGAVLGLLGGSFLTLITAGYMSSNASHWIGETTGDAAGLPIFGWSTEVGDLRVAHFVATHMMQGLPLLGWFADRMNLPLAKGLVWAAAFVSAALVLAVFGQALLGEPLLPLN